MQRPGRGFDDQLGDIQPDGAGAIEERGCGKPQPGMPDRRINNEYKLGAIDIRQSRMRGDGGRQVGTQEVIQGVELQGTADRVASHIAGQQCVERTTRASWAGRPGS